MGTEPRSPSPRLLSDAPPLSTRVDHLDGDVRSEAHLRAGSVAALRSLRAGMAECLGRGGCPPEIVLDAQLVVAEIATNAFVHDAAPLVDVQVTCREREVVIRTWHRATTAPPPHPVEPTPRAGATVSPGGRGLAIVDQIVATREVANSDGCTTTVVRLTR